MVPKMLSGEQKQLRNEISSELFQRNQSKPDLLKPVIAGD
jgi:hypothetical protein